MTTNTIPAATFTAMGALTDMAAVNGCLASGMIVIVEANSLGYISGIVSAHSNREQARIAYAKVDADEGFAIVFPTENGPQVYYTYLLREEFDELCSL